MCRGKDPEVNVLDTAEDIQTYVEVRSICVIVGGKKKHTNNKKNKNNKQVIAEQPRERLKSISYLEKKINMSDLCSLKRIIQAKTDCP